MTHDYQEVDIGWLYLQAFLFGPPRVLCAIRTIVFFRAMPGVGCHVAV